MKRWEIKCPLKIILLGEHAVLYTKRAVTMAIDLYLNMVIVEAEEIQIIFNNDLFYKGPVYSGEPSLDISFDEVEGKEMQIVNGILNVIRHLCIGCIITITSDVPLGCGLGTSAAASISLSLGCLTLANNRHGLNLSKSQILNRSYELAHNLDNFIHGEGSGIDVLTCFYGGVQYYDGRLNSNGTIHKYCTGINLKLPTIHVIYTRVPKDTREMVSHVSDQFKLYPSVVLSIMNTIDELISLVLDGVNILNIANYCHNMLVSLGVSHPRLQLASSLSGHSKLTGSGNGGCLLSFGELSESQKFELNKNNFDVYKVKLDATGVVINEFI
eukprot:NODE_209_length_14693_cov_0.335617.p6 type:complete len:328 gc:universal NODE_209_length_14693_cov_0.335617:12360-11377(-)